MHGTQCCLYALVRRLLVSNLDTAQGSFTLQYSTYRSCSHLGLYFPTVHARTLQRASATLSGHGLDLPVAGSIRGVEPVPEPLRTKRKRSCAPSKTITVSFSAEINCRLIFSAYNDIIAEPSCERRTHYKSYVYRPTRKSVDGELGLELGN